MDSRLARHVAPVWTAELQARIRRRRKELRMNQQEFARRLGISQSGVSKMEKLPTRRQLLSLWQIAQALEMEPEDLLR